MVDRLFRWIVDFLLWGRVLKELYKFFTVCVCTCPVAVCIRKQEEKKRRQGSCFLFLFFQKKKKSNFYLISYVTDSFEFFKRYEKFSAEPWMRLMEKEKGRKKKEKREREKILFFLPRIEGNCWSDIGKLVGGGGRRNWMLRRGNSLSRDELHLPRELTRLRFAATSVYGIPRMRALIVVVVRVSRKCWLLGWVSNVQSARQFVSPVSGSQSSWSSCFKHL